MYSSRARGLIFPSIASPRSACAKRFTTHEVWVEELRKNDDDYIPLDRREEYKFLMRKLKSTKSEVLEIMGIKNAAQKG